MTCPASGQAEFGIVVRQILCCIAAQPSWSTKTMALAEDGTYERCGMRSHSACVIVCMLQCNPRSSGMKVLSVLTSLLARCILRTSLHYSRDCVAFRRWPRDQNGNRFLASRTAPSTMHTEMLSPWRKRQALGSLYTLLRQGQARLLKSNTTLLQKRL